MTGRGVMQAADGGIGGERRVIVGRICGIYGVSGWVKVISYTRPRENLFRYSSWLIGKDDTWQSRELTAGRPHGKGLIAKLAGVDDRDAARACLGKDVAVSRAQMPALPEGEYYWFDLVGLKVRNREGIELGEVSELRETGANDVLVVTGRGRHLIPMILDYYVLDVDLDAGWMTVDWEPGD